MHSSSSILSISCGRSRHRSTWCRVLNAELTRGSLHVSLADVLAFVITVWASFLASRFVRFVLEENVYPRVNLSRGLPFGADSTSYELRAWTDRVEQWTEVRGALAIAVSAALAGPPGIPRYETRNTDVCRQLREGGE